MRESTTDRHRAAAPRRRPSWRPGAIIVTPGGTPRTRVVAADLAEERRLLALADAIEALLDAAALAREAA